MDYTPKTLAEKWATKTQHVLYLIGNGQLAAFNVALTGADSKRPVYRISAAEVERFENARTVGKPTPQPAKRARRQAPAKFYA